MIQPSLDELVLPLARHAVDRDYLARSRENLFDELWENEKTRVLAMHNGAVLLNLDHEMVGPKLQLMKVEEVPSAQLRVYLGKTLDATDTEPIDTPVVLAILSDNAASAIEADTTRWHNLRKSGLGLSDRDSGLFTQALALANWHETHVYCPRCGTPTLVAQGGWVRRCFKDDSEVFPRTDPAIIVSVIDREDRILLGSQGTWEQNRWSVLAGFVEPGESLNHAVLREMFEEAGVRLESPQYLGSQAWPFPYSLMLGFTARLRADSPVQQPDGIEIEKLRWFTRAELAAEAPKMLLPNRISIARAMIERWFGSDLVSATESGNSSK
ncbi:MAG: NAD(+) diphosphatase [Microbacteriaceae bacterium]